jgi:hypothetical protein
MVGEFNAKLEREDILNATIENESLHQTSDDNGVKIVDFATSKMKLFRAQCSRIETFINTTGPLLMGRITTRLITY